MIPTLLFPIPVAIGMFMMLVSGVALAVSSSRFKESDTAKAIRDLLFAIVLTLSACGWVFIIGSGGKYVLFG